MRSYTNKKGEKVHVDKEHLDNAVKIKIELQKASPSRRCNWSQLVRMMDESGFDNAENSENYRCLIKNYQKSIGELPTAQEHIDMLADNKVEAIKKMVGELAYEKRHAQNTFRELNKVKRDVIDKTLFAEEVRKGLSKIDLSKINFNLKPLKETHNKGIVKMTDWHIGLKNDVYNYEIAKRRVKDYATNIVHYCKLFNISEVSVLGIGDLVEGAYMRRSQAFDLEFTYSEQVVKATEIVSMFLLYLSKKLNVVYLGSVLGNHSRMYDKGATISGDSAENIIDASVKSFIKLSNKKRLIVDDKKNSNYDISFTLNNVSFKAVHGDLLSKNSKEKVLEFISTDNQFYDCLLYGHFHHMNYKGENNSRMSIGSGSLCGTTNYSKHTLGYTTPPSQTLIVLEGDKVIPINIELN